jgi:macrolide transport system ATP-binding/permease protein
LEEYRHVFLPLTQSAGNANDPDYPFDKDSSMYAGALALVLRKALWQILIGVGIGAPAALFAGHLMASLLFKVSGYDPLALIGAILLLVISAMVAGFIPAGRAASADLMQALRTE